MKHGELLKRKTPSTSTSDDVTKQATKEKPKQPIDVVDLNNLPWDPVQHDFGRQGGNEAFVTEGFNGWNKTERTPKNSSPVTHQQIQKEIAVASKMRVKVLDELAICVLVVVAVARKHLGVVDFFDKLTLVTNVVCTSCKRKDILIDSEKERVEKAIGNGEVETGRGKNQELSLIRAGDTRWNSHYKTILRLIDLLPYVIKVLEFVENEGNDGSRQNQANGILVYFESFDFVFYLHMMKYILGLTNILSQSLQKDDQDIVEAVSVVQSTKEQLKEFRLNGFVPLLDTISSFYMQIQEFNDRFSEESTELLRNMACLNPCDSFSQFNTSKLVRLSDLYPNDFDTVERMELESQLNLYYANVTKDDSFVDLNGITDLAIMMVKKRKHISYPLVYRLLKLALVLPVATASVERCFSAIKIIKSDLRNRISQGFLNSCVICGVEREALANVNDEDVMKRFQNMTDRKGHL
ncbi:zinc finger MYM-type protein 1-like protein [Tanacetum coccineum]